MKKWTKESIRELLNRSDKAVERGLLVIYNLQTDYEQASGITRVRNGVGFSAFDADFMSSLAEGLKKYGRLTPRQMRVARKKLMRYAGQLAKVANGEIKVRI